MEIVKNDGIRTLINGVEGVADGLALNYLVEGYKLPGYGIPLFSFGTFQDKNTGEQFQVQFGVDDLWQTGLGIAIAVLGGMKKNSDVVAKGVGMALAPTLTKGTEMTGVAIKPDPPVGRVDMSQGTDGVYRAAATMDRGFGN